VIPSTIAAAASSIPTKCAYTQGVRFLVVDDDPEILRMMARLLGSRGHVVETQEGPFGTSVAAMRVRPDVILLDCMMPALDGVALSALLTRTLGAQRPRLILWSADDETLRKVAAESGLETLSKRQPIESILDALEQAVRA
jgi:two-component system KDP operon response regulator KdpE